MFELTRPGRYIDRSVTYRRFRALGPSMSSQQRSRMVIAETGGKWMGVQSDQEVLALLDAMLNMTAFHREHEKFYSSSPREQAV